MCFGTGSSMVKAVLRRPRVFDRPPWAALPRRSAKSAAGVTFPPGRKSGALLLADMSETNAALAALAG